VRLREVCVGGHVGCVLGVIRMSSVQTIYPLPSLRMGTVQRYRFLFIFNNIACDIPSKYQTVIFHVDSISVRLSAGATKHRDSAREPSCYLDTGVRNTKATCLFHFKVLNMAVIEPSDGSRDSYQLA
jgi:hypothetical protein